MSTHKICFRGEIEKCLIPSHQKQYIYLLPVFLLALSYLEASSWPSQCSRLRIARFQARIPLNADSSHDYTPLHCTEPFIITLTSPWYDLNNVERDVNTNSSSSLVLTRFDWLKPPGTIHDIVGETTLPSGIKQLWVRTFLLIVSKQGHFGGTIKVLRAGERAVDNGIWVGSTKL